MTCHRSEDGSFEGAALVAQESGAWAGRDTPLDDREMRKRARAVEAVGVNAGHLAVPEPFDEGGPRTFEAPAGPVAPAVSRKLFRNYPNMFQTRPRAS